MWKRVNNLIRWLRETVRGERPALHPDAEQLVEWLRENNHPEFDAYRKNHPERLVLSNRRRPADLSGLRIGWFDRTGGDPVNLADVVLDYADLSRTDFGNNSCRVEGASFRHAKLIETELETPGGISRFEGTDFTGADLSLAILGRRGYRGGIFIDTEGLYAPRRVSDLEQAELTEGAIVRRRWDRFGWSSIRAISSLHLRAVSYATFLVIVLYIGVARWFSITVDKLQEWQRSRTDSESNRGSWLLEVPDMPIPGYFGWQILAVVALAIAATIYSKQCPEQVQTYRRTEWVDEHSNAELEYRAADYSRFRWRLVCAALYWPSVVYTSGYLLWKGWAALRFLW